MIIFIIVKFEYIKYNFLVYVFRSLDKCILLGNRYYEWDFKFYDNYNFVFVFLE